MRSIDAHAIPCPPITHRSTTTKRPSSAAPHLSDVGSSTKRSKSTRSRAWVFTLFHDDLDDIHEDEIPLVADTLCADAIQHSSYLHYGIEQCPETGRTHLQGYVYYPNPRTMSGVKRHYSGSPRLSVAHGTVEQNIVYCSKDGRFFTHGKAPAQGTRSDLETIKLAIADGQTDLQIAQSYFAPWCRYRSSFNEYRCMLEAQTYRANQSVTWIFGPTGSGKTRGLIKFLRDRGDTDFYWKTSEKGPPPSSLVVRKVSACC